MKTARRRRPSTACSASSRRSKACCAARSGARSSELHQNAQRLLKPLFVVNPYVEERRFPDTLTRMRRDHVKYLTLDPRHRAAAPAPAPGEATEHAA